LRGPKSSEFEQIRAEPQLWKQVKWTLWRYNIYFVFSSIELFWSCGYLAICILSQTSYVVPPFQCLDIAVRSDTVQRVIQAIFKNSKQLIWTCALLVILVLIYSSFLFHYFNNSLQDGSAGLLCHDWFQCFIMVLDYGLRNAGGVADLMTLPNYKRNGDLTDIIGRVFFDLSFFILVIVITLHVVFGMIVDAFKDLRQEKMEHQEDQENVCFICSLHRTEYEKYGNFERHSEDDHSLWNYLFYLVYLKEKNRTAPTEMTDIETYIFGKYLRKNTDWFPVKRSITYEKLLALTHAFVETDEYEELRGLLKDIEKQVKGLKGVEDYLNEMAEIEVSESSNTESKEEGGEKKE